jgi:hypothetical protein
MELSKKQLKIIKEREMPADSYYVNDWLIKNDCPFEWSEHKGYSGVGVSILFYRSRDFLTNPRHVIKPQEVFYRGTI